MNEQSEATTLDDSKLDAGVLKEVGQIIHEKRVDEGVSQGELSKKSGLSRYYISCIERGSKNITVMVLRRIARVLGLKGWQILQAAEEEVAS